MFVEDEYLVWMRTKTVAKSRLRGYILERNTRGRLTQIKRYYDIEA